MELDPTLPPRPTTEKKFPFMLIAFVLLGIAAVIACYIAYKSGQRHPLTTTTTATIAITSPASSSTNHVATAATPVVSTNTAPVAAATPFTDVPVTNAPPMPAVTTTSTNRSPSAVVPEPTPVQPPTRKTAPRVPAGLIGIAGNGNNVNATIFINSPVTTMIAGTPHRTSQTASDGWPNGSQPECIVAPSMDTVASFTLSAGKPDVMIDLRQVEHNAFNFQPIISEQDMSFVDIAYHGVLYKRGMQIGDVVTFQVRLKPDAPPGTSVQVSYSLKRH